LILAHDCSQIAFIKDKHFFVHDIKTQKTVSKVVDITIANIWFSLDGSQLWSTSIDGGYYLVEIDMMGDWSSAKLKEENSEDKKLLFHHSSPFGYQVTKNSMWVTDHSGSKLLWLPPNWRRAHSGDLTWNSNFLALLDSCHPEAMVIEFQL
jgi:hypothetical protein